MITLARAVAHLRSQATTHPRSGETGEWRKDLTSRCIRMVLDENAGLQATIEELKAQVTSLENEIMYGDDYR